MLVVSLGRDYSLTLWLVSYVIFTRRMCAMYSRFSVLGSGRELIVEGAVLRAGDSGDWCVCDHCGAFREQNTFNRQEGGGV
jgi:hypothetical protein